MLESCLSAIMNSNYINYEVILVVDTRNTTIDSLISSSKLSDSKLHIVRLVNKTGPAAARNYGAKLANSEILIFIDSDVKIKIETITELVSALINFKVDGVFGSYTAKSQQNNFWSSYKQLFNHYVHQLSAGKSTSFWGACSAIKKDIFNSVGGFSESFNRPSIEDIELGYRINKHGYLVRLEPSIQVEHLKKWTFFELIHSDLFDRALPWSKLVLADRSSDSDLNLKFRFKLSSILSIVLLSSIVTKIPSLVLFISSLICYIALNFPFYKLCYHYFGLYFCLKASLAQYLYYIYSVSIFSFAVLQKLSSKLIGS
jgi:glycosyltransferase involved in cell wall biosynthesis